MDKNARVNKVQTLIDASKLIPNGAKIAIGGVLLTREPVAMIHELIRQKRKDFHLIGGAHSFAIDLMCAAKIVKKMEHSFIGFEFDLGLALNYRRASEKGEIEIKETDCNIFLRQLQASEYGLPFMPMPKLGGTDLIKIHPEFKIAVCPYTQKEVTLVPAVKPDIAIIHAHLADKRGNVKIFGPIFKDRLLALTADKVIVTVEKIISEEEMKELEPTIAFYHVDSIVQVNFGAHPTSCYPNYSYDRKHLQEYTTLSKKEETINCYLDKYIYKLFTQEEYLEEIGGNQKIAFLKSWNKGINEWMEVFK